MDLKSVIGRETSPKSISVEQGQMQFFAKATGAKDKIYWDLDAAKAAGHAALPAPPTFLFTLDSLAPSTDESVLKALGVNIGNILHGEQRFVYGKQIYAGDTVTLQSRVTDAYEKKGGALKFVISETSATNQHGENVGTMINSLVIR